jgi:hypothetical protein
MPATPRASKIENKTKGSSTRGPKLEPHLGHSLGNVWQARAVGRAYLESLLGTTLCGGCRDDERATVRPLAEHFGQSVTKFLVTAGLRKRIVIKMVVQNKCSPAKNQNPRAWPLLSHRPAGVLEPDTAQGVTDDCQRERFRRDQEGKLASTAHGRNSVAVVR